MLLAGDMFASWQNPVDCNDVNQDGVVSSLDALNIIRQLNSKGAGPLAELASGEPGSSSVPLIDTNGDGHLTASDAHQVIEFLNAQGEGEILSYRLEITDTGGNVVTNVSVGDEFQIRGLVQDLRDGDEARGVFAAYLDVTYDETLASVVDTPVEFGANYTNGRNVGLDTPGLLDEIGAFANATPLLNNEFLLFSVTMQADANGVLTVGTNAADILPARETLFFGAIDPVSGADIDFGSAQVTIGEGGPGLSQFFGDVTVELESPRNLPLDGVDPSGLGLTYTVDVADDSLVEATIVSNDNRFWELNVAGFGTMVFEFYEDKAPRATERFIDLTEDGFFDGLIFHRVIDSFMIQGGDPLGNGTGGSDLPDFDDQFHVDLQHNQFGVLSMAKSADDTNNSQFFITDSAPQHLDFNHTVFGQLIEGFDVLAEISSTPTGARDLPVDEVVITSAHVYHDNENALVTVRALESTGTTSVSVTAMDVDGNSTTETFEVTLAGSARNSAPFLDDLPEEFVANMGETVQFQLEYTDVENDPVFFFAELENEDAGEISVSQSGLVTMVVPVDATPGTMIPISVAVSESPTITSRSPFDLQIVNITIDGTPTLTADEITVDEDTVDNSLDVLANDELGDGVEIISVFGDVNGLLQVAADGQALTFTPTADFFGETSARYIVRDGAGQTSIGEVNLTVENVLDPPTAMDDVFPDDLDADDADRALYVEGATDIRLSSTLINDRNVDGNAQEIILYSNVTDPQNGSVTWDGLQIVYTPNADFFGSDSFDYTVRGVQSSLESTATITVNIAEVNDAPVGGDDTLTVTGGVPTNITADSLLANDSAGPGEDTQTLTISEISYSGTGTATLNGDGVIEYAPSANFQGIETIVYTILDDGTTQGDGDPLSATATLTITVEGVSLSQDDSFTVDFGSSSNLLEVLANDDDSAVILDAGTTSNATLAVVAGGIEYTPNAGFTGTDTFTYAVRGTNDLESTSTVTVTVSPEPSVAIDDMFTVQGSESFDVLANDELGTGASSLLLSAVEQPANGFVGIVGTMIQYLPDADFVGTDTFSYTATDDNGNSSGATVTVTVEEAPNANPTAFDDNVTVEGDGTAQTLGVLANDSTLPDVGEVKSVEAILVDPASGTATIGTDGDILYRPNEGFSGTDRLEYRMNDGNGGTDTAVVDIVVNAVAVAPVAVNDSFAVVAPGIQTYSVLGNDIGEAGETLMIVSVNSLDAVGTVAISADQTQLLYTPDFGQPGPDSFTYTIDDGTGLTSTATVTVNVAEGVDSFYSGSVFTDFNNDGIRNFGDRGVAGVAFVLSGTTDDGAELRRETRTSILGDFEFNNIPPGDYTVSELQPAFTVSGQNTIGSFVQTSDEFDLQVSQQLITSGGNAYANRGMAAQFALLDALSSARRPGLRVVMEGDELAWVEDRGGWSGVGTVGITMDGDALNFTSSDSGNGTLSMKDRSAVNLIGRSGDYTFLRINGTSDSVLSAAAVDQVMAS